MDPDSLDPDSLDLVARAPPVVRARGCQAAVLEARTRAGRTRAGRMLVVRTRLAGLDAVDPEPE